LQVWMSSSPDVSVVIPTRSRPELVTRAVRSALTQTLTAIEVIVVIDGPDAGAARDEATAPAIAEIGDERVRVVALPKRSGAPGARNAGIRAARAPWTALLDDDDEWLPRKLEIQLDVARRARVAYPVVGSRLYNHTPRAEFVMPRRLPEPGEDISEYLTVRRGLFHGDGFIQTSTILAPTELLRRVPFTRGLKRLQELDWTLRALSHNDVDLLMAAEPLVIWHTDEDRPRVSLQSPWEHQWEWLQRSRPLMTKRAYAALAMSVVGSMAATTRSPRIFRELLTDARRHGRPSAIDYVTYLQIWLIPPDLRHAWRDRILSRRRVRGSSATPQPETPPGAAVRPGAAIRVPANVVHGGHDA
jgi:hypothetical protein